MQIQFENRSDFLWVMHTLCAMHRKPFSAGLTPQQLGQPENESAFVRAALACGFEASACRMHPAKLHKASFPLIAWLTQAGRDNARSSAGNGGTADNPVQVRPVLILQADASRVLLMEPGDGSPRHVELDAFSRRYLGHVMRMMPVADVALDPDSQAQRSKSSQFGFSWFLPELKKHKRLWQEIVLASLVIQLMALATPLFTQTIIDKVVVHHTQSTLIVIAIALAVFMLFSAALSWARQYLVLHTGNRVDAALGATVFERLFKLPPKYFQHRPTGVIAARLHGVETVREFIASAAITLVLDLPFLLVFVAVMFYYSVSLSLIVLAILVLIVGLSLAVAPMFQRYLQEQFQLGARNQAFLTEYVAGLETVKSLQLEQQLNSRYGGYLSSYLNASFSARQLANSYNTLANLLEQVMTLLILAVGAYSVMQDQAFTIGMLVAFQMFAGKVSQPLLRLVGLWQQFQQARLSVDRLGDLMNVPTETYSVSPTRESRRRGEIRIEDISFGYEAQLPLVYQNLSMEIPPGQCVAIMGPSGSGKSTLAKLLQGFYLPSAGRILLDGIDIRHLAANELRCHFGVVPQETTLFSGTIHDNLQMVCPDASFEDILNACKLAEIHQVIEALPQGYQTEIGERGAGLSGGQKQRIAIARALLKRPRILIFDEATSALDTSTAENFAHTINKLKGKVSMLFITHGLPRGLQVDAVYTLGPQGAHRLGTAAVPARTSADAPSPMPPSRSAS